MMSWTKTPNMQQMFAVSRLSQQSNLHPCSRESPTTIFCPVLPVFSQASGTGSSEASFGRSPCPCPCQGPEPALQVIDPGGAGTPGARVCKLPAFTSLVVSISQPDKHRCCLPLFGAAGGSGFCSTVSEETLGSSPFCYPWCCIVHWPPPTAPFLCCKPSTGACLLQVLRPLPVAPVRGPRGHCSPWPTELQPPMGAHAG